MSITKSRNCLAASSCALLSVAAVSSLQALVLTVTDTALGTNTGKWSMVYDTTQPATLNPAGTSKSKGLYSLNAGTLDFSWLSVAVTPFGIQTILPHTGSTTAILGLGSANTLAVVDPLTSGAIASIDFDIKARQTSTPNDTGMVAGLLIQDGKYYRTTWQTFKGSQLIGYDLPWTGLTASSFGKLVIGAVATAEGNPGDTNFTSNPDFSAFGGQIQLGYIAGYDPSLGTTDVNNRSVTVAWTGTIRAGTPTAGDANWDGNVNSVDFDILVANFGTLTGATWAMADFDADAKVTTTDFNVLAGHFGPAASSLGAVVPEPASLGICSLGITMLAARRRALAK